MTSYQIAVVSLNLKSISLDGPARAGGLLNLLEQLLKGRLVEPCLKHHDQVFPAPFLSSDLDLARWARRSR